MCIRDRVKSVLTGGRLAARTKPSEPGAIEGDERRVSVEGEPAAVRLTARVVSAPEAAATAIVRRIGLIFIFNSDKC